MSRIRSLRRDIVPENAFYGSGTSVWVEFGQNLTEIWLKLKEGDLIIVENILGTSLKCYFDHKNIFLLSIIEAIKYFHH